MRLIIRAFQLTRETLDRKIENFIRTKYDSKRWVMDGPMPNPATLDVGDDDVVSYYSSFLADISGID